MKIKLPTIIDKSKNQNPKLPQAPKWKGYTWVGIILLIVIALFSSSCYQHFHFHKEVKEFEKVQPSSECTHEDSDGYIYYKLNNEGLPDVNFKNDSLKLSDVEALLLLQNFLDNILVFPERKTNIKRKGI